MKLQIKYKIFYKTIDCPKNTFTIGVKINHNIVANNTLHHIFENVTCITQNEILPDGTKIKFYFYTCDLPEIRNIQKINKSLPALKITGENFIIETLKDL